MWFRISRCLSIHYRHDNESSHPCHRGGIGRRAGFKIQFSQESVGSTPTGGIYRTKTEHASATKSDFFQISLLFGSGQLRTDLILKRRCRVLFENSSQMHPFSDNTTGVISCGMLPPIMGLVFCLHAFAPLALQSRCSFECQTRMTTTVFLSLL